RQASLVVVCTPVEQIAQHVRQAAAAAPASALITDAGSTKEAIVAELADLPAGATFIGSHPLAGSEKAGPAHARADLLEGRVVVVTPRDLEREAEALGRVEAFWEGLGARIIRMTPREHDAAVAATSHAPHAVASV